jgi:hypothetical protein
MAAPYAACFARNPGTAPGFFFEILPHLISYRESVMRTHVRGLYFNEGGQNMRNSPCPLAQSDRNP